MDYKKYLTVWNAVIIGLLVFLMISRFGTMSFHDVIITKLLILPGVIIGISFHEFAHAYSAYKLGDNTPMLQNRVTIDPRAHLDVFGFLALLLAGFGWGKPVQIDPRHFKNDRRDSIIVSLAGVTTNLIMAVIFSLIYRFVGNILNANLYTPGMTGYFMSILFYVVQINLILMIFNLIPIPPLDGFGTITEIFQLKRQSWYWKVYQNGFLILIVALLLGVIDAILRPSMLFMTGVLNNIAMFY